MTETISKPFENLTMPEQQTRQTASLPEPHITITIAAKTLLCWIRTTLLNTTNVLPIRNHLFVIREPKIATQKTTHIKYISNIYIVAYVPALGTGGVTKTDAFSEKYQGGRG